MSTARDAGSDTDRGVSNVVGFILVFSFLIVGFTVYQGLIVPAQNRQAEFDHNRDVHAQMQDVRNAIQNAAGGTDHSATVRLDAEYPQRTLSDNLAISSGSLQTREFASGITITNATPVDGETGDYFNASAPIGPLSTSTLTYRPSYTRYTSAPTTVYENTVAYNRFDGGQNLTLTDQNVVDGRRITLVALNGNLSEAGEGSVTVDTAALSASTDPVAVQNTSGGKINVTIPTELSAANWSTLLEDQMDTAGADEKYVESVEQTGPGLVSIVFEPGVTYDLRLARVGVGAANTEPKAHYVTDVSGDDTAVAEGGTRKLVVEVRDRFNNPVSNRTVEAEISTSAGSGDFVTPADEVTDGRGRASFVYHAPGSVDDAQAADVTVFFDAKTPGRQNVTFDVEVLDADGSGGGACGNDPGTGGEEEWCSTVPNTTVSQPGGVISNVGSASHIKIADPSFSSLRPDDGQVTAGSERFRLAFVLEKEGDTTGTTRYMFVIPDTELGMIQDLDNTGTTVTNRNVVIYRDASHNQDGFGWQANVSAQLLQGDLNNWYTGDLTIDLLDASHYSLAVQDELDAIKSFMQDNDVRIYVVDMDGRVEITID